MTGLYGTTAGPWAVPRRLELPNGKSVWGGSESVWSNDDRPEFIASACAHGQNPNVEQRANARAIAQVPAMLALVDAVADWVNIEDVRDMARAIVKELEAEK